MLTIHVFINLVFEVFVAKRLQSRLLLVEIITPCCACASEVKQSVVSIYIYIYNCEREKYPQKKTGIQLGFEPGTFQMLVGCSYH